MRRDRRYQKASNAAFFELYMSMKSQTGGSTESDHTEQNTATGTAQMRKTSTEQAKGGPGEATKA